jgi:hypothetical protein
VSYLSVSEPRRLSSPRASRARSSRAWRQPTVGGGEVVLAHEAAPTLWMRAGGAAVEEASAHQLLPARRDGAPQVVGALSPARE